MVFRCAGDVATLFFVFRADATYCFYLRDHLTKKELESGRWVRSENGELVLRSNSGSKVFHLEPVSHKAYTVLCSPDHELVKLRAPTPQAARAQIDALEPGRNPLHLFVKSTEADFQEQADEGDPMFYSQSG